MICPFFISRFRSFFFFISRLSSRHSLTFFFLFSSFYWVITLFVLYFNGDWLIAIFSLNFPHRGKAIYELTNSPNYCQLPFFRASVKKNEKKNRSVWMVYFENWGFGCCSGKINSCLFFLFFFLFEHKKLRTFGKKERC